MIIKLNKYILYLGIGLMILTRLFKFMLVGEVTNKYMEISQMYLFSSLIDTAVFAFELILLNEVLRQIKKNHSFTILFILLFFTHFFSFIASELQIQGIDFEFAWISMLLYWPLAITIAIKYFQLEGRLSDVFKVYAAFELLALLAGISVNFLYRYVGLGFSDHLQWILLGFNFITNLLLCYVFFESSKCLEEDLNISDDELLGNI